MKCHRFPGTPGSGGTSSNRPTQGGGTYLDAQCYIKALTPEEADALSTFNHYIGFCRDAAAADVVADGVPGVTSLSACKNQCESDTSCTAFEFFPGTAGWLDMYGDHGVARFNQVN